MEPLKLLILSWCFCLLALTSFIHAQENNADKLLNKDAKDSIKDHRREKMNDSTIFRVKRLNTKEHSFKHQLQQKKFNVEMQKQRGEQIKPHDAEILPTKKPTRAKKFKNFAKNSHLLNKKMLSKLGFTKVKSPNSHNRKRLAIESRRHVSPDDSHMFIIKLPPNLNYYSAPKDVQAASISAGGVASTSMQYETNAINSASGKEESADTNAIKESSNGKKVSFPFSSNGRPGRIYHWNLPIIKKILEDKQRFPNVATATKNRLIDIKDMPTWRKPWENEAYEKPFGNNNNKNANNNNNNNSLHADLSESRAGSDSMSLMSNNYKKSLKRKSPSYYAPKAAVSADSFNKYFSGNGKPKGFYVIKENQKKPLYYKNIIS